jgi:dTDP-4-dehydrorhamnose 3,5-epimerase
VTLRELAIPGAWIVDPIRHHDERGFFARIFDYETFDRHGLATQWRQSSLSFNARSGTVRGLHFQQAPHAQAKLVRALRGAIYDVAVDVRPGSATYGQWVGAKLTAEGGEQLLVPRGFAHGYCTLTDNCEIFYKVDGLYAPQTEGALLWNDPDLAIDWPITGEAILSDKDRVAPRLKDMPSASF